MSPRCVVVVHLLALALAFATQSARADSLCGAAAADLYYPCSSCHGVQGEGNEAFAAPALAGQQRDYLQRQLTNFRTERRGAHPADSNGAQMTLLAKTLRDPAALESVACFAAAMLVPSRPLQTFTGNAKRGRTLYRACAACHGDQAQGNPTLQAPALRQLADWYVIGQLQAFRAGWRGRDSADLSGQQMAAAMLTLPDAAGLRDVTAFITTLY